MQPIAISQDFTRTPLNDLLGTKANVRLLRILANEVVGAVGAPEAADQAGLTVAGARRALKRLARTGFVEPIGGGRTQKFRLNEADPLCRQLRELFGAEESRHEGLIRALSEALEALTEIDVAWIDTAPTDGGEPLHLGIMAGVRELTHLEDVVRQRITEIEGRFNLAIELHLFSGAEIEAEDLASKTILLGYVTDGAARAEGSRDHEARLERSRRVSEMIADMLARDPSLRRRAERHVESLLNSDQGTASHDLREWRDILANYSLQLLRDFLVSDTERARRLRQSSPFFAVLTHEERDELLSNVEAER